MNRETKNNSQKLGKLGEERAKKLLMEKGFDIMATNWRYHKYEIDIIARNQHMFVFVEVKTRKSDTFGEPEEFVSAKKQSFIITAAHHYLVEHNILEEARFDIIAIIEANNSPIVKHIEGAFYPKPK